MSARRVFSKCLRQPTFTRLSLEQFESRIQPSVYLVHTFADNGSNMAPTPGSLREAINYVNGGLHDEIQFDMFFTPGATKISVPAPLPPLAKFAIVGGGTMPGMLPMEINGSALVGGSGLTFTAGGTLKGVSITGFPEFGVNVVGGIVSIDSCTIGINLAGTTPVANKGGGIALATGGNAVKSSVISANGKDGIMIVGPGGNLITGNTIGLNPPGTAPAPNSASGIKIDNSPGNTIGGAGSLGNIIAGNAANGILVAGKMSTSTIIKGNTIGNSVAGNTLDGILVIDAPSTIIGGKAAGEGNVIANNKSNGVQLMAAGGLTPADPGALIEGNFIGTNAAGTADLGNKFDGIRISGLHNNTIGGTAVGAGNLISGNDAVGINIGAGNKNTVQGNKVGLNAAGTAAIPNTFAGVAIASATNTIGGTIAAARNLISGNTGVGVIISGAAAMGNIVAGNWIGLAADGVSAAGNKTYGILVNGDASKNFIGGTTITAGNTIAFNGETNKLKGHGVVIASGVENLVRLNSLYDNYGRGIDLGSANAADNVTINTEGDADTGANNLQDYPVVVSRPLGASADATWQLNSSANSTFTLDFYSNDTADASGFGEGKTYLGSATVTTDAQGNALYAASFGGKLVSATATDSLGNTSEFSMIDSDADGLADKWETVGMDIDEDEIVDLTLAGASDVHKDMYVEIDSMTGYSPTLTTLNDLVAAFAAAPNSLVHNPDGSAGVTLHLTTLAEMDSGITPAALGVNYWAAFDVIKNANRGTVGQRGAGNAAQIKTALEWTHRYCLFAQSYGSGNSSGVARGFGVSDFIVTLPSGSWGGLTSDDRAGTFMHELGHTLNLRHGGFEDAHYKPNYVSVMNYAWQFPDSIRRTLVSGLPSYSSSWKLDYSRSTLPSLNENSLDETVGLQATPGLFVPYGEANNSSIITGAFVGPQSGPIDWNGSGLAGGTNKADINFDGKHTTLDGFEDWSVLRYYFLEKPPVVNSLPNDPIEETSQTSALPPTILSVTFGDGTNQRSLVKQIVVNFSEAVSFMGGAASAFTLTRTGTGLPTGDVTLTAVPATGLASSVTLTFSGSFTEFDSLVDGLYDFKASAAQISGVGGALDGNNDTIPGGNYDVVGTTVNKFFRYFGDSDGDGAVTQTPDFIDFRNAFGSPSTIFDFDNDTSVDQDDFIKFRNNFGGAP